MGFHGNFYKNLRCHIWGDLRPAHLPDIFALVENVGKIRPNGNMATSIVDGHEQVICISKFLCTYV